MAQDGAAEVGLSQEELRKLSEIRTELQNTLKFVSSLGDGGWNHGAKVVYATAELLKQVAATQGQVDKLLEESGEAPSP